METQTPREIVRRTLTFNEPARIARHTWILPWAQSRFPEALAQLAEQHPDDIQRPPSVYRPSPRAQGDPYAIGTAVDEWGCEFRNVQAGVIGEVKEPLIASLDDWESLQPPYEVLPENAAAAREIINRACAESDRFMLAACCPRPWERYQFIRGTANAMLDFLMDPEQAVKLLRRIHEYYMAELEFWVKTDVDAIMFMDDWGDQRHLLIDPALWREFFKPLYRDYCALGHAHGKFAFMHSDGCIESVYEDLVEVGVDAVNSQLFTMDLPALAQRVKGRITFWGEIDRQHILPDPDPEHVRAAVRRVAEHLYDPRGGIIAQFELGPGAQPQNAAIIYEEWALIHRQSAAGIR